MKRRIHKPAATLTRTLILGISIMLSCNVLAKDKDYATTGALAAEADARQSADTDLQNQIDDLAPSALAIGDAYGGGVVFYVNATGTHGLVAATQDQSASSTWFEAQNAISDAANHDTAGQAFTDWRLPTKHELDLLYGQRAVVGGFADGIYWSSTEGDSLLAWDQYFLNGGLGASDKGNTFRVRAVRAY